MELSSVHEKTVQHQFDSFCKRVLKNKARDYDKGKRQRSVHEILFSELSKKQIDRLNVMDEYFINHYSFNVLGYNIAIKDELIGEALSTLSEQKRDILLLSYFLEMTDREIGEMLNMIRSTVQYKRTNSLKELKKYMGVKVNAEYSNKKK